MKKIRELPDEQRPYERCISHGPKYLSDAELLAVILRTGTKDMNVLRLSEEVLGYSKKRGISAIYSLSIEELMSIKGIGRVKAVQLVCVGELARRLWRKEVFRESVYFEGPEMCASYYMQEMRYLEQEEMRLAFLDTKLKLIADETVSIGTVDASVVSVREILVESLKHRAVSIIMLHNHPSGNPIPSKEDISVTKYVKKGCELVGLELRDHIIIGDNIYYSFKEQGAL